jgi:Cu/Ag efflux protein CusF
MTNRLMRVVTAASLVAVAVAFALPARAEDKTEKPKKQQLTGTISAIDAAAKTVTINSKKEGDKTFTVTDKTKYATATKEVATLDDLKQGDKVQVSYTDAAGKLTAAKIMVPKAHEKKEKK